MFEAILSVGITAIASLLVAVIYGIYNLKNTQKETESSPYEAISERVKYLESSIRDVEEENKNLKNDLDKTIARLSSLEIQMEKDKKYIHKAVPWIHNHVDVAKTPPPEPPEWWAWL